MRRLLVALVLGAAFVPSTVHADGCPPSTCGTTSSAPPGSDVVFVRPNGRQGPLDVYDVRTGARRFRLLTYGVLSADGRSFVSSAPRKDDRSTITRRDARSGHVLRRWSIRGRWGVGAASLDGRILAYARGLQSALVLLVHGRRYVLRGAFEVEALSPDARRVFLIRWRRNSYELAQLDLATGRLSRTRLADADEKMTVRATNAVATRDGRWLFTLYVTSAGTFVHALDLARGIAHCIDLPLRGDFLRAGTTSLTLSPDETRLYLASPLVGRMTTVDVTKRRVTRTLIFPPADARTYTYGIGPSGAVSPNGRMLAFVSAHRLWLVDTAFGVVRGAAYMREYVLGVGFAPGGREVVAITAHGRLAFDAATGKPLG